MSSQHRGINEGNGSDGAGDTISISGLEKLVGTDDPDDGDVLGAAAIADNVFDGGAGPDDIDGGDGIDTVTYAGRDEPVEVSFLGGGGSTNQGGPLDGPVNDRDQYTSIENATGGNGADDMSGSNDSISRTFNGGPGNDELSGGDVGDLLIGGRGKDRLFGLSGIDILKAKDRRRDKVIDCGDGANSQEKAKFDQGIDPAPISC